MIVLCILTKDLSLVIDISSILIFGLNKVKFIFKTKNARQRDKRS